MIRVSLWPSSSQDRNPWLCYSGRLENKTNATSHPNIDSLKAAIEDEGNKMSEKFILKACKLFRKRVNTITKKWRPYLGKFTVFCLSSYFVAVFCLFLFLFLLILFYNGILYHYTRIFQILHPHSVSIFAFID